MPPLEDAAMAKAAKVLTPLAIEKLKPKAVRFEVPDAGQRNLLICVFPSGRKSFICRYRFAGTKQKLTFGGVSLAQARKLAADAMFAVAEGRNPAVAKKADKAKAADAKANTLQAIAHAYFEREGGKLRTVAERQRALRQHVFPKLGACQIDDIKRTDIVRLLDRIEDNAGAVMADRVLAYLRRIMSWHAGRSEFKTPIVRGMSRVKPSEIARDRILSDDEIRKIWKAAGQMNIVFGPLVQFLLLTGARKSEASRMRYSEVADGVWTIPASRNKAKKDDAKPLSNAALALLKRLAVDGCDLVFTNDGRRPMNGFSSAKTQLDQASGVSGWRIHDVRRTARSLLSRAGISSDIGEMCLGHVLPGVRGVYDRHKYLEEKKTAFEALAALVDRILNPVDNVTPMRRRR
jgi:integrase